MSRWRTQLDDLVARRGRALVAYAYIVCGDRHEAEDLVQEALVRVFSRLRSPTTSSTVYALQPDAGPAHPEAYVRQAILAIHIDDHRRRLPMTGSTFPPESDDARLREAIGHTFEALADQITETELEEVLPDMRRRIATRRRLKVASVGAGALALVGAVAVTAWATPWREGAEPVQPAQPTTAVPSTSATMPTTTQSDPTPTAQADPTPTAQVDPTPTAQADQVPTALNDPRFASGRPLPYTDWEGWACGASIDEVLAHTASDRFRLEIASDVDLSRGPDNATAVARITDVSGEGLSGDYTATDPLFLWTQDGRVVEGHAWMEGGGLWYPAEAWGEDSIDTDVAPVTSVSPGGSFEVRAHAVGSTGWHCGTRVSTDESPHGYAYPDDVPPGQYQLYAIAWYDLDLSGDWTFVASDPVTVTLP